MKVYRYVFPLYDSAGNNISISDGLEEYIKLLSVPIVEDLYKSLCRDVGPDIELYSYGNLYIRVQLDYEDEYEVKFFVRDGDEYKPVYCYNTIIDYEKTIVVECYDIRLTRYLHHGLFIDKWFRIDTPPIVLKADKYVVNIQKDIPEENLKNYFFLSYSNKIGNIIEFIPPEGNRHYSNMYIFNGNIYIPSCVGLYGLPKEFTTYEFPMSYFREHLGDAVHIDICKQKDIILKSYEEYYPYVIINKFNDRIFLTNAILNKLREMDKGILTITLEDNNLPRIIE